MKKIGIIDADLLDNGTRHPNLALMKISGYFKKKKNYNVRLIVNYDELLCNNFDRIYVSKVFSFTNVPPILYEIPQDIIKMGGTGFFPEGNSEDLPDQVEHHMPDYELYNHYIEKKINEGRSRSYFSDYLDYSIGFTTRGCFRKCPFCVNKKYDKVIKHSPVSEFLDVKRKRIYLWDDNFLGYDRWYEILEELNATGKPFQFRQGLDIRLLNTKKAKALSKAKYIGDMIFAFDNIEERELIIEKIKLWRQHSKRTTKLFLLCGYHGLDEHDIETVFKRIKILMKFNCLPYVMRYDSYKESPYRGMYVQLARWCNQPHIFKKMSFREFCHANQKYHKNPKTKCSALRAMLDFERRFPELAEKYFDMRFEEERLL